MTQRDRIVLIVAAVALVVGAFFMVALKPKRQEAADLGRQLNAVNQRVETARATLQAGEAARATFSRNYAQVARLGKAVPTDDDVPSLVFQLESTAQATGVDFRSVKLTSGSGSGAQASQNSAQAAAATQDASKQGAESGQGDKQEGATQPAAPAAPTQAATAGLPPGAVVGPAGLSTMPFSFAFEGSFFRLSDFLTRLERYIRPQRSGLDVRGRLLLINGLSLSAASQGFPKMKATIAAQAYLLPASEGLFDGATPQAPAGAGANQPVGAGGSGAPVAPATAVMP